MRVPVFSPVRQYKRFSDEIKTCFEEVAESGKYILGDYLEKFEKDFAGYIGTKYAIGVASGTDALFISLMACGIEAGDMVITTPLSYIATSFAISMLEAEPVFVDVEENSCNIDMNNVDALLKKDKYNRIKAIIPVHLYGTPCNMTQILYKSRQHKLRIIEDCCQAAGAVYNGSKVGSFGDCGCFSFYPTKPLACMGDGGMVTTNDELLYKRMLLYRNQGKTDKYSHNTSGINSRLDAVQAKILSYKLGRLDIMNEQRRVIAHQYYKKIKNKFTFPVITENTENIYYKSYENTESVYHIFQLRHKDRDSICNKLEKKEIETLLHYPIPIHLQGAYDYMGYEKGDFPVCEKICREVFSIPMFAEMCDDEIEYVIKSINEVV